VAHSLFIWNDYHKFFSGVNVLEHDADYSRHLMPSVRICILCIFTHKVTSRLHGLLRLGDINKIIILKIQTLNGSKRISIVVDFMSRTS
jgi:hypothetical protein